MSGLHVKPPLGLRPRYIADAARMTEVRGVIMRYVGAGILLPAEWIAEYNELAARLSARREGGV